MLRKFPEEYEAFAAVAVSAKVKDFGAVRDFGGRVAGREFRHAALVMLADFHDFFERGREVAQVALVFAFECAPCRIDGEVVCAFFFCAILARAFLGRTVARAVTARNFAHIRVNRSDVFPEYGHVVPVHCKAVLVEVDSRDFQARRQKETVTAHAAAQVVHGTFVRPNSRFPPADVLRGALLQCELVAQQKLSLPACFFEKFFTELRDERFVVHDGGALFVAVAGLV